MTAEAREMRGTDHRGSYRLVKPGRLQPGDLIAPDPWRGRKQSWPLINVDALIVPVTKVTAVRRAGRIHHYEIRVEMPEGLDINRFANGQMAYPSRNLRVYDSAE